MTINGINGVNTQMWQAGVNQATDSYSKNIQNQIANAQKAMQELSSNGELTVEEKMKKRQEIQKQISDLNVQLRQHQMEQRREKQQAKNPSADNMPGGTGSAGNARAKSNSTGLSQAGMTAMISADSAVKQAKVQGSVAARMDGRSGILESEIKLDRARGCDTHKKEEELAKVEQKAQEALSSQLSALADAGRTMEEAAEAEAGRTMEKAAEADAGRTMEEAAEAEAGRTMEEAAKPDSREEKTDKNAKTEDTDENVPGTETPGESAAV